MRKRDLIPEQHTQWLTAYLKRNDITQSNYPNAIEAQEYKRLRGAYRQYLLKLKTAQAVSNSLGGAELTRLTKEIESVTNRLKAVELENTQLREQLDTAGNEALQDEIEELKERLKIKDKMIIEQGRDISNLLSGDRSKWAKPLVTDEPDTSSEQQTELFEPALDDAAKEVPATISGYDGNKQGFKQARADAIGCSAGSNNKLAESTKEAKEALGLSDLITNSMSPEQRIQVVEYLIAK